MSHYLQGLGTGDAIRLRLTRFYHNHVDASVGSSQALRRQREQWILTLQPMQVLQDLSELLLRGNPWDPKGFTGPILDQQLIQRLQRIFEEVCKLNGTNSCWDERCFKSFCGSLSFSEYPFVKDLTPCLWKMTLYFAAWPFGGAGLPSTITYSGFTRAAAFLFGKFNSEILCQSWGAEPPLRRSKDRRLKALFRSIAAPGQVLQGTIHGGKDSGASSELPNLDESDETDTQNVTDTLDAVQPILADDEFGRGITMDHAQLMTAAQELLRRSVSAQSPPLSTLRIGWPILSSLLQLLISVLDHPVICHQKLNSYQKGSLTDLKQELADVMETLGVEREGVDYISFKDHAGDAVCKAISLIHDALAC